MSNHATGGGEYASDDPDCEHDLQAGDHVIRWTHIALYPIQVHGIVLSAGPGIVTLADFGLTSRSPETFGPSSDDVTKEEKEIKTATGGSRRLVVITLTEENEIKRWRKVDYGGTSLSGGKLKRLLSNLFSGDGKSKKEESKEAAELAEASEESACGKSEKGGSNDASGSKEDGEESAAFLGSRDGKSEKLNSRDTRESEGMEEQSDTPMVLHDVSAASRAAAAGSSEQDQQDSDDKEQQEEEQQPSFPKSDPPGIVLARVRYLLEHETVVKGKHHNSVLPPYHLFYANSECIAVFCKTGTFSTFQAAVFLHSTAIGQAKSAATLALFVGSQTVPITSTVSAGGILGWFGATTTTTTMVPLLSINPWLIPVLAGYGIAAVGTPYIMLMKAKGKWEKATRELNDGFWGWAGTEVYVEAIKGWSGLRSD
jgi:hypothetical protein